MKKEIKQSLLIDGEWREAISKATKGVENPATGQIICEIGYGGSEDALLA